MFGHGHGTHTRAAAAVRDAEGLVQVQVRHVPAEPARTRQTHQRIEVGTVHVHLATGVVNCLAHHGDVRVVHTVGRGVGDHDAREFITHGLDLGFEVLVVDQAIRRCGDHHDLEVRQDGRRRIGSMRRGRDQDGLALGLSAIDLVPANGQQTRQLTLRARVGLNGHRGVAGDLRQPGFELLDQLVPALRLVLRGQRVDVGELGPGNGLHLRGRVELHGARAQRNHGAIQRQILVRELAQPTHQRRLGTMGVKDRVGHVLVRAVPLLGDSRQLVRAGFHVLVGGARLTDGLQHVLHLLVGVGFAEAHTHGVRVDTAQVDAALGCGGKNAVRPTRHGERHGVEEPFVGHGDTALAQPFREAGGQPVQSLSQLPQLGGTVVHRVRGGHDRQQRLSGANVRGRLLAADVLFAGLQRQTVGRGAGGIRGHTHDAAGHGAFHARAGGHERRVRATVEQGHAEALGRTHRNIRTGGTGALQRGQGQEIGAHGCECAGFVGGVNHGRGIDDVAVGTDLRDDHTEEVPVRGQAGRSVVGAEIRDDQLNAGGASPTGEDGQGLRQRTAVEDHAGAAGLAVGAAHHQDGLGHGGGLVQQGRIGDIHAGQVDHGVLEGQQQLQAALGDLRLVRGVRGVETRVLQDVAPDRGGSDRVEVPLADHLAHHGVLGGDLAHGRKRRGLVAGLGQVQGVAESDALGDGAINELIETVHAHGAEHGGDVFGVGADVTGQERHARVSWVI